MKMSQLLQIWDHSHILDSLKRKIILIMSRLRKLFLSDDEKKDRKLLDDFEKEEEES